VIRRAADSSECARRDQKSLKSPVVRAVLFLLTLASALFSFSAHASVTSIDQALGEDDRVLVVTRARVEVSRVVRYSGQWTPVSGYPMGDIPHNQGACTDLVVRALRVVGLDLQQLVHEDIKSAPGVYGVDRADAQVDHRRVAILYTYFRRHLASLSTEVYEQTDTFEPGDIVFFGKNNRATHIAIVSNRMGERNLPLILENGGPRPQESDTLDSSTRPLVAHFRIGRVQKK
jgi:uncharacterized protein YijF (DUF1287 family)